MDYYNNTINNNVFQALKNTLKKINTIPNKFIVIFWFLGPFIYLIERTPGDAWLSIIALLLVIKSIREKNWSWANQPCFKFALLYWIWSLLVACQGPMPLLSLQEGFVWIRFPLYAAAVQSWIACNRDIRGSMIFLLSIASITMSFILFAEFYFVGPFDGRLSWPYGDIMSGNFIAKTCMPAMIVLTAICLSKIKIENIFYVFCILISIVAVTLTGERTSMILTICACLVTVFSLKLNFKTLLSTLILLMIILIVIFFYNDALFVRFSKQLIDSIPILNTNTSYWGTWRSGLQQGLENFWMGVGPTGSRHTCGLLGEHWLPGVNYCGNHPHNFYIQMFAETGFIGLIIGCFMIFYILKTCWLSRKYLPNCFMAKTAFIIPLAVFFPFQQTGSFFGQWNNLFMWFAIGFALSNFQNWQKIKKNQ